MSGPIIRFKDIDKDERRMLVRHVCQADGAILAWIVVSIGAGVALGVLVNSAISLESAVGAVIGSVAGSLLTYRLHLWTVQPRVERAVEKLKNP